MKIRSISNPDLLDATWNEQYTRVAQQFSRKLSRKNGLLVEIGCGRGQLTIPLWQKVRRLQIIAVDRFAGPYSGNQREFQAALAGLPKSARVKAVISDYRSWLSRQPDSAFDAVISSEFLPEIDSNGMRRFFDECYRVLNKSGITIHSFLSARPRNAKQRRLLEADSNPKWTKTPPVEWFSPPDKLAINDLNRAGFRRVQKTMCKSGLVVRSEAARQLLADWDVRKSYWSSHREELERDGLEIPDWIIIDGLKL